MVYSLINALLPQIYEAIYAYSKSAFVMPELVKRYPIGEIYNANPSFALRFGKPLAPQENSVQFLIADIWHGDTSILVADIAQHIGSSLFGQIELDLVGDFANFTNRINGEGHRMTWEQIYQATELLSNHNAPLGYALVVSENQWNDLCIASPFPMKSPADTVSRHVGCIGNVFIYTTPALKLTGAGIVAGIFNYGALGFDIRRPMRIELGYDNEAQKVVITATIKYVHGVVRPSWGVQIRTQS